MESKKPYYHAIAFISDIHANLEALDAVLQDIEKNNVSAIYCLGDLVGYGPDPNAVVKKIIALKESKKIVALVCGNHDYGVYHDNFEIFNSTARMSNQWTRKQLEGTPEMEFLGSLANDELSKEVGRFFLVHSTVNPEAIKWEYLKPKNASQNFVERKIVFVGHSHTPAIYSKYQSGKDWNPVTLFENDGYYYLPKIKEEELEAGKGVSQYRLNIQGTFPTMIVNIGSVGQPRDAINHARYLLYINVDFNSYIEYRQVGYDIETTLGKHKQRNLECDRELAIRLYTGGGSKFSEKYPRPEWFPFES